MIPGSGPQSNDGFGGVAPVGALLRGTDLEWYFWALFLLPALVGGDDEAALRGGSEKGVENKPLLLLEALGAGSNTLGFCGVSNARGAGLACAAWVLSSGSVRMERSASLSRCADCSAFSAAAVVLATCGVTSSARRTTSRSCLRDGVPDGLPLSKFSFATRAESADTSTVCWRSARSIFREVRLTVSSDGGFILGLPVLNSLSFFLEDCKWSSILVTRSWIDRMFLRS